MGPESQNKARRASVLLAFFVFLSVGCQGPKDANEKWIYSPNQANAGPSLSDNIDFLEERLKLREKAFLEQAELAGLYLQRARATRSARDLELAERWYERSLKEFESASALLVKAEFLQMEHNFQEALSLLNKVLAMEPGNVKAQVLAIRVELAKGDVASAKSRLDKLPDQPLSSMKFLRAQVAEAEGDVTSARALYEEAIRREADSGSMSESARMRDLLARLEISQGRLDEARALLESARSIPVEQPLTELLSSEIHRQKGQLKEAAALLRLAYEKFADPTFLIRLGEVQRELGEQEAAKKTFETAAQVLKSDPFGHERDLALALFYLDPGSNSEEIDRLMQLELKRRKDPETLRIAEMVKTHRQP